MDKAGGRMLRLGITGGAGSGKSAVCERLRWQGASVIQADELARRAVMPEMPAYEKIVAAFGEAVLAADGGIDRARLRRNIISDSAKKELLEKIVHPEVSRLMQKELEAAGQSGAALAAVEVPLLFETGMESFFDFVLTVSADPEVRIRRLLSRDHISREDASALMGIQMPEEEKRRRSEFVIDNSGSLSQTHADVDRLYKELLKVREKHEKC
ncbi:MAG: dephospho-CoA kinase [Desulfosalsimonadaceae bacterium]